jgi:hypothetical protein
VLVADLIALAADGVEQIDCFPVNPRRVAERENGPLVYSLPAQPKPLGSER